MSKSNQLKNVTITDLKAELNPDTFTLDATFAVTCSPTPAQAQELKKGAKVTVYITGQVPEKRGPGRPVGSGKKKAIVTQQGTGKPPLTSCNHDGQLVTDVGDEKGTYCKVCDQFWK